LACVLPSGASSLDLGHHNTTGLPFPTRGSVCKERGDSASCRAQIGPGKRLTCSWHLGTGTERAALVGAVPVASDRAGAPTFGPGGKPFTERLGMGW